ncbi:MAG TPA: DUF2807 domain-containing protein [Phnomibacter sp.]|nr:DUF2807 domain-containing protein [Phnomibacter sp.]
MKKTMSSIVVLATVLLMSCTKDVLRGEGSTITETRSLQAFSAVEVSGNRVAEIIPSVEYKVEVTGYQNLVPVYSSIVSNGKLYFEFKNHRVRNDNISLKIYTPTLSKLNMSGNTDISTGALYAGEYFEAFISGNGVLRMAGGTYGATHFNTSGSAKIYASNVSSNNSHVSVSGNGHIELKANNTLDVEISGNGEVHYWGNPAITSNISGNGKMVKH